MSLREVRLYHTCPIRQVRSWLFWCSAFKFSLAKQPNLLGWVWCNLTSPKLLHFPFGGKQNINVQMMIGQGKIILGVNLAVLTLGVPGQGSGIWLVWTGKLLGWIWSGCSSLHLAVSGSKSGMLGSGCSGPWRGIRWSWSRMLESWKFWIRAGQELKRDSGESGYQTN